MSVHFLVYLSIATKPMSPEELMELLAVSRRNNTAAGITGMLLYKDAKFMQLLEGSPAAVRATYKRIQRDPRHREITLLLEGDAPTRDFEDWSMGFQVLDEESARATPGFTDFLETTLSVFEFASDPSRAHQLLRIFRRT